MSDTERPDLLVPDTRVVSIEEARAQERAAKEGRNLGRAGDFMTRAAVRDLLIEFNAKMTQVIGQQVYDQIAEETQRFLQAMELDIEARILARLENERRARSFVGRVRALIDRARQGGRSA